MEDVLLKSDDRAHSVRPSESLFDEESEDEEIVFLLPPQYMVKGFGCPKQGVSERDRSESPLLLKPDKGSSSRLAPMGSTATSCRQPIHSQEDNYFHHNSNNSSSTNNALSELKPRDNANTSETKYKRCNTMDETDGCDVSEQIDKAQSPQCEFKDCALEKQPDLTSNTSSSVSSSVNTGGENIDADYVNNGPCEHIPDTSNDPKSLDKKTQGEFNNGDNKICNKIATDEVDVSTSEGLITQKNMNNNNQNSNSENEKSRTSDKQDIESTNIQTETQTIDINQSNIDTTIPKEPFNTELSQNNGDLQCSCPPVVRPKQPSDADGKTVYSYNQAAVLIKQKIEVLLTLSAFTGPGVRPELRFLRRTTSYSSDVALNRRLVDTLVRSGVVHVFLRIWKSVTTIDFMDYNQHGDAFKSVQCALSIIWNCTDKSTQLCESLVTTSVVHALLGELASEKVTGSNLDVENNLYLVKAYLGILHNVARLCADSRKIMHCANAVNTLQWYLINKNDLIKTNAYLILAYVITDDEEDLLATADDHVAFMVGVLRAAVSGENHFSKQHGFWALEVLSGLNHLAVNDKNKLKIGGSGALSLYVDILRTGSEEEKAQAVSGLWILAFKDENKHLLREEPGCIEILSKLTVSGGSESTRRAARGALWVVQSVHDRASIHTIEEADVAHVMVSYHHKSGQQTMIKVVRRLRQAGYKVWMDLDHMHGSTLEAMALAIERACCVLVCMTQGYKDSPSCRTEAEYTYRLRKDIIPLLLQDGYVPDGWLGAFVGTRLHFDFSAEHKIPGEVQKVVRELGTRGKLPTAGALTLRNLQSHAVAGPVRRDTVGPSSRRHTANSATVTDPRSAAVSVSGDSFDGLTSSDWSSSSTGGHSYYTRLGVTHWSTEDIRMWLDAHLLSHVHDRLEDLNGELLLQLKNMQRSAPEYFYSTLEHRLHFDLVTTLRFTRALEDLQ